MERTHNWCSAVGKVALQQKFYQPRICPLNFPRIDPRRVSFAVLIMNPKFTYSDKLLNHV